MGKADFVAMGRVLLCVLLLAASVQLCVASTAEGTLVVTELSDHVNAPVVTESAKKQAQTIVAQAKAQAAAIKAKADGVMEQADGMKQKIEEAQAEIQKQKRTLKVETKATKQALTQATQTAAQAQTDGAVAAKASQDAQVVQKTVVQQAAKTKKEEKKTLGKLEATKVMAAAKAAEQMESATAQTIDASQAKADATTQMKEAKAAKEALSAEIVKVNAAHQRNKDLENKLNDETKKEEAKSAEAQKAVGEVQLAKSKIKLAAKAAIKAAVDKAAAIAHSEQDKLIQQQAQEREKQGTMSAQSLAQEAKVAAQATLAQQEMAKAKQMMAAAKVKSGEEEASGSDSKHKSDKSPASKKASSQEQGNVGESTTVWDDNVDTTNTLLEKMYKSIPYKAQCGALADDATNIESRAKMSFGACTVRCTSEFKCKSFEYDHAKGHCSISPRQLLTKTSAGAALACATKKVLVTSSMQLPSKPDVFTKRESASSAQEVQKEAKVDAKLDVQKTKARVKGQVTSLTQKGEELEAQKIDAETKEKVEEANASKQIHQANKLKTELKQQDTVTQEEAIEKTQSRQALESSDDKVRHLKTQLAEAQSESKADETALQKQERIKKVQDNSLKLQIVKGQNALSVAEVELENLQASATKISKGSLDCDGYIHHLTELNRNMDHRVDQANAEAPQGPSPYATKIALMKVKLEKRKVGTKDAIEDFQRIKKMIAKHQDAQKILKQKLAEGHDTGEKLAMGMRVRESAAEKHPGELEKLTATVKSLLILKLQLQAKADSVRGCERKRVLNNRQCQITTKNTETEIQNKLDSYVAKAAITERGRQECQKALAIASSESKELKTVSERASEKIRSSGANMKLKLKAATESFTSHTSSEIRASEKERCNQIINGQVKKLTAPKRVSKKCAACARLKPQQKSTLQVDCSSCRKL